VEEVADMLRAKFHVAGVDCVKGDIERDFLCNVRAGEEDEVKVGVRARESEGILFWTWTIVVTYCEPTKPGGKGQSQQQRLYADACREKLKGISKKKNSRIPVPETANPSE
jgi:hypothetical protein